MGPVRCELPVQRNHLHQRLNALALLVASAVQPPGDVVCHIEVREQRTLLRHKTNPAQVGGNKTVFIEQRSPLHDNAPGVRRFEPGQNTQQRGFPRPGRPDNRRPAPRRHAQV